MTVRQPSPMLCPNCGRTFIPPDQLGISELKRLATARVHALEKAELLAELKAVRDFLDDVRAKVSRLRKHDLTLHRTANVGRLGRKELRESLDGARARIQKLRQEERALLNRLQKLQA